MENEGFFEKGVAANLFRKFLLKEFGEEGERGKEGEDIVCRIESRLGPQAREMFSKPDVNAWYPVELMKELYECVDKELSARDPQILLKMGRHVADESARGFLRYLARLASVRVLISRMKAFWKHYHKGGGVEAEIVRDEHGSKQGIVRVYGYPVAKPGGIAMQGFIEAIVKLAGARNLTITPLQDFANSEDTFSWTLSWE